MPTLFGVKTKESHALNLGVLLALVLALAALAVALLRPEPAGSSPMSTGARQPVTNAATRRPGEQITSALVQEASASVVNVSTSRPAWSADGPTLHWFRRRYGLRPGQLPPAPREQGQGSGVVVSADGLVLTSAHVVEGAEQVRVTLAGNRELEAEVVGVDNRTDVALLRLRGRVKGLRPMPLGQSARVKPGDPVLALGNPFGLGFTVTRGIVSAKGRAELGLSDYDDFIQTDAALNPGSSGGALVNMRGELVGLNTAVLAGGNGVGFAVPSDLVRPVMASLKQHGRMRRGWLGLGLQDLLPRLATALKVEVERGVLVGHVVPGSPASRAGLLPGDVVLSLNGTATSQASALRNRLAAASPGSRVTLELMRDKRRMTVKAALQELPGPPQPAPQQPAGAMPETQGTLVVSDLTPAIRRKYRLPLSLTHGVVLEQISPHSPAAELGLDPGDVILEVDQKPVNQASQFHQLMRQAGDRLLRVFSERTARYVLIPGQPVAGAPQK